MTKFSMGLLCRTALHASGAVQYQWKAPNPLEYYSTLQGIGPTANPKPLALPATGASGMGVMQS